MSREILLKSEQYHPSQVSVGPSSSGYVLLCWEAGRRAGLQYWDCSETAACPHHTKAAECSSGTKAL